MNEYEKHIHRGNLKPEPMPSEYESLRKDFEQVFAAINDYAAANRRHAEAVTAEIAALWADNAELRDELHALANRHESLTRLVAKHITLTAPEGLAGVAELRRDVFGESA